MGETLRQQEREDTRALYVKYRKSRIRRRDNCILISENLPLELRQRLKNWDSIPTAIKLSPRATEQTRTGIAIRNLEQQLPRDCKVKKKILSLLCIRASLWVSRLDACTHPPYLNWEQSTYLLEASSYRTDEAIWHLRPNRA